MRPTVALAAILSCHSTHGLQLRTSLTTTVSNPSRRIAPAILSLSSGAVKASPPEAAVSIAFLLGASALWGTYPATIKSLFAAPGSAISPGEVTLLRFLVMAAFSAGAYFLSGDANEREANDCLLEDGDCSLDAPWQEQFERRVPSSVYFAAGELGAIGLAGTLCNTVGLSQIPALTGAVLLTFLNIFVPVIGAVAGATEQERQVDTTTWLASIVALAASIYALLPDAPTAAAASAAGAAAAGAPQLLPTLGTAELSVLSAAFFFAAAKVRLSSHLKVHGADVLTTGRVVAQAGLAAAGLGVLDETNLVHELLPAQQGGMGLDLLTVAGQAEQWIQGLSVEQIFWIVSSSLLSGAFALWCQGRGQSGKGISAPRAQLFFSTTPLFGALWAFLLLHEPITNHELSGGLILLLGLGGASLAAEVAEAPEAEMATAAEESR